MKIIRHSDADFSEQLEQLVNASSLFDRTIEEQAREILEAVRERGDAALLEFTGRFDKATLTAEQLPVSKVEFMDASLKADPDLREAVAEAQKNIAAFAKKSLREGWQMRNSHGGTVGEKMRSMSIFRFFQSASKAAAASSDFDLKK